MSDHIGRAVHLLILQALACFRKHRRRFREAGRNHAIERSRAPAMSGMSAKSRVQASRCSLCLTSSSTGNSHDRFCATARVSVSTGTSSPLSSRARSRFAAHSRRAMLMKSALAANSLPTQIRRQNPKVACPPARFVSAGPAGATAVRARPGVSLAEIRPRLRQTRRDRGCSARCSVYMWCLSARDEHAFIPVVFVRGVRDPKRYGGTPAKNLSDDR